MAKKKQVATPEQESTVLDNEVQNSTYAGNHMEPVLEVIKKNEGEKIMFSMLQKIQEARKAEVKNAFGRNSNVAPFDFDSEVDKTSRGNDVLWILAKVTEEISVTVAETATGQFHAELHQWADGTPTLLKKDPTGSTKKVIEFGIEAGLWTAEIAKEIKNRMDSTRAAARKKHSFQKAVFTKVTPAPVVAAE